MNFSFSFTVASKKEAHERLGELSKHRNNPPSIMDFCAAAVNTLPDDERGVAVYASGHLHVSGEMDHSHCTVRVRPTAIDNLAIAEAADRQAASAEKAA